MILPPDRDDTWIPLRTGRCLLMPLILSGPPGLPMTRQLADLFVLRFAVSLLDGAIEPPQSPANPRRSSSMIFFHCTISEPVSWSQCAVHRSLFTLPS